MNIEFFTQADNQPGLIRAMKDWPDEWDDELRRLMPTTTNQKIAKQLGATPGLVGFRIQKLGISRTLEDQERLYGNLQGRLVMGMNAKNQQAAGTCRFIQKRPTPRPKAKGGMRPADKPEWWIFLGKGERMPLRRYLWETWIGPVPKGHNICFADGDTRRCILQNLICLPNNKMTSYFHLSIKGAMQRRAFWNSPRAKESYQKASQTRIAFNRTEEGKAVLERRSEKMRIMNAEDRNNNPFRRLHDNVIAHYLTQDPATKKYLLENHSDLIDLKRTQLLLNRAIKQHEDESKTEH